MSPIEWTEFVFTCRGCRRPTRLDRRTLLEQNAIDAALGTERTLAETAARFEYCAGCNSGRSLPGEHDVPPASPPIDPADPAAEWLQAIRDGKWPPQQDEG